MVKTPLLADERRETGVVFIYICGIWQMVLKFRLVARVDCRQFCQLSGIFGVGSGLSGRSLGWNSEWFAEFARYCCFLRRRLVGVAVARGE